MVTSEIRAAGAYCPHVTALLRVPSEEMEDPMSTMAENGTNAETNAAMPDSDITNKIGKRVAILLIFLIGYSVICFHFLGSIYTTCENNVTCQIFSFVLIFLAWSAFFVVFWALFVYAENRSLLNNNNTGSAHALYHDLAKHHFKFTQIWFSIAIAVFLGGVVYGMFHLGSYIFPGILPPPETAPQPSPSISFCAP
ncbi:MAG: hypothetical protein GVY13_05335 [Alphaproteobacteria bacterium]|nr:hypothetical protein [Alphaproteobacteria bacterium]